MRKLVRAALLSVTAALFGALALAGPAQAEQEAKVPGKLVNLGAKLKSGELSASAVLGPFVFSNIASGGCLDQDYSDGTPHTAVTAWTCNGGANQQWNLDVRESDYSVVLTNAASGHCLDQDFTDGVPHTNLLAWPCNGNDNQRWWLYEDADGSIFVVNFATEYVLDQDYTDGVPHNRVTVWPYNGGLNQRWWF
ncbi:RICIN domain-containing protein [Goodfellowiella coeruleoviolacea]|uniref:Ricin-type beta-trefoil lectin domain-containing protein n=1 Tax=Goodfellowiella coeruleoviolacea TaxID=334858 RepID=A0AAE3GF13_9PSEU|nr:RICIN domain-containing protein [Goodfellowiella coeruleoviolacea]MCP2166533.1 Ricin-type beta-trefoil lectin domain-containing protein [Goodfellowiella coeruleoviolacea]